MFTVYEAIRALHRVPQAIRGCQPSRLRFRSQIIPADSVQSRILTIRGQKVILDADLAAIYGVTTKRLNEQVKRNKKPFRQILYFA